jgi:hypothetical protein
MAPGGAAGRAHESFVHVGAPADEFAEFAGVTPAAYLRQAPREANHLPVGTKERR